MNTRGRASRSPFNNPGAGESDAGDAAELDRTLRALYTAYEALRDISGPPASAAVHFNASLADLLRAPNWWRAAQQQLATAHAVASDVTPPATGPSNREATVPMLARALSSVLLAAVLLRLPYDAWRPDVALLGSWLPADSAQSALANPAGECAALLAEIGMRCRLARCSPQGLVAVCRRALAV